MTNQTARWQDGERATFFKAVASLNQLHKDKPSHGELLAAANLNPRWAQNMLIKTAEKVEMMGDPKVKQPLMDAVLSANLKLHAEPDSKSALMAAVEVYSKVLGGR
jgi:hypothetical protein